MRSIRVPLTILAFLLSFAVVYSLRAGFDPSANVTQSPLSLIFSTDSNSIYTSPFSAVFSTDSNPIYQSPLSLLFSTDSNPIYQSPIISTYSLASNPSVGSLVPLSIISIIYWEKTDGIYANRTYVYNSSYIIYPNAIQAVNRSAVPVYSYIRVKPINTSAEVGKPLYVSLLVNVTNVDSMLKQTFTNIIVNNTAPPGFILLNSSTTTIPSLSYGETYQYTLCAKAVPVYEKAKSLSTGQATYMLTVNSSIVSELPVVHKLSAPPDWDKRVSYSITVDGKTTGFVFDPDTLTLNILPSFSHSSLEPGDHVVLLTYKLSSPPKPNISQVVVPIPTIPTDPFSTLVRYLSLPFEMLLLLLQFLADSLHIPKGIVSLLFIALLFLILAGLLRKIKRRKRRVSWTR